ncbi:hypothetical protein [Spirochaeta africana]|uniref:Uncharacterized protein n=1 Tax=Spirochaeta africana (strain ATCC 700263 / DSM 8902 / Z-7692) TaxID=889378 RepID=H9UHR7_SPIAZ|nr:hypothetical protein [Spirochaeta africana]AFG37060.1 hypothetical protein Spiaf_0972 [Spirochaeta africana DSM 8902]
MRTEPAQPGCAVQWTAFATGFLAVWPALLAGVWLQSMLALEPRSAAAALWYAALPEELIKFAAAALLGLFGAPAVLVGLGFGVSETVFLVSASPWPLRLLTSVPLHAGTTALALLIVEHRRRLKTGTLHHRNEGSIRTRRLDPVWKAASVTGLLAMAILLHWIYNLAVRQAGLVHWLLAWLPLILWLLLRSLMNQRLHD